eukprot:TRINITY_DN32576_c0_g1_i1.p1 TRINITY_DN32576_c0_g1~~TRINITY_DN32576_c0_g1_i1.p1  ORF type:complete len:707 (-),score=116.28 TRINITY_DN32576_c0_g1_i1:406-2526(-)
MHGPGLIRPAEETDFAGIIHLARQITQEPDAFTWDESSTDQELEHIWLPEPDQSVESFVMEADGHEGIVGVYVLHPASACRGSHIANGLYMVAPNARCKGLGKALCAHSVQLAKARGYSGMRINMVVSTNSAALRVCAACGFKKLCSLPKAFQHPQRGLVDAHLMFHDLECMPEPRRGIPPEEKAALVYPTAPGNMLFYSGEQVCMRPQLGGGSAVGGAIFSIQPPLPQGMQLDPTTGVISGTPVALRDDVQYCIKVIASSELTFRVEAEPLHEHDVSMSINEDFAIMMEKITRVEDLLPEPSKIRAYGDWMIWMVHRAWLNDPTLVDFNFNNMHMPPGHLEKRIAPKLMAAMEKNTHIEVLSLSNSNVQRSQGIELANSLRSNTTLRTLNLECNFLDSDSVRQIADGIKSNPRCGIEHLRFSHQKQMASFFGRPTEEAVGQMMQTNELIVKLGFECDDRHWRNLIDRALLRNNDAWRRRNAPCGTDDLSQAAEERSLGQVVLLEPPEGSASEVRSQYGLLCSYIEQTWKLPTTAQLQNFAKNAGFSLTYTKAVPMIREFRSWMMNGATGKQVIVLDPFNLKVHGQLLKFSLVDGASVADVLLGAWSEPLHYEADHLEQICACLGRSPCSADKLKMQNGKEITFGELTALKAQDLFEAFPIQVEQQVGRRCLFRSTSSELCPSVSEAWADWLKTPSSPLRGSRAGA